MPTACKQQGKASEACRLSGDALRGGERAVHLLRNPLHSARAYANFAGNLVDASISLEHP
jgi:hypothetical protein